MPGSEDKELIKNVRVSKDAHDRLLIGSVCDRLREQGFNVTGTMVSYYSPAEEMYIFLGKDPIPHEKDGIGMTNLNKSRLHLKFRPGQDSSPKTGQAMGSLDNTMNTGHHVGNENSLSFTGASMVNPLGQNQTAPPPAPAPTPTPAASATMSNPIGGSYDQGSNDKESNQDGQNLEIWSSAKANRRTKERKISFVIEKVSMWRKLYNGIQDNSGKIVRYRHAFFLSFLKIICKFLQHFYF